jgi:hypothetical protein
VLLCLHRRCPVRRVRQLARIWEAARLHHMEVEARARVGVYLWEHDDVLNSRACGAKHIDVQRRQEAVAILGNELELAAIGAHSDQKREVRGKSLNPRRVKGEGAR